MFARMPRPPPVTSATSPENSSSAMAAQVRRAVVAHSGRQSRRPSSRAPAFNGMEPSREVAIRALIAVGSAAARGHRHSSTETVFE
jgi:hypothetical protein